MNAPASRRAGANLLAFLTAPSCRLAQRQICLRATQLRPISSSPRMRQQQSAPAPAPSPSSTPATTTPPAAPNAISTTQDPELRSLTEGFSDAAAPLDPSQTQVDWARSFHGLSSVPFTPEQAEILQQPIPYDDIEIKPDGIIYLPEIKYRRILNKSFGPGGWGLVPRGETIVTGKLVTREYGLVCGGRLVSTARGEQQYFDPSGIPTATEGCKSNALMRCCKDLGIASELWDPRFIKKFMAEMGREMIVEHQTTKKRRKHFMRRDDELKFPLKEVSAGASGGAGGGVKR